VLLARGLPMIGEDQHQELSKRADEVQRMLTVLIKKFSPLSEGKK
jgi:hypothetical protein